MASFKNDPADFNRLDYSLLKNGSINLYYKKEILKADIEWFKKAEYRIVEINTDEWVDESAFHKCVGKSLGYSCVGGNLNCFRDHVGELDIPQKSGMLIVLMNFDKFYSKNKELADIVIDIIAEESRFHMLFGNRLITMLQLNNPKIELPSVGAMTIGWNSKEWFDTSKGV